MRDEKNWKEKSPPCRLQEEMENMPEEFNDVCVPAKVEEVVVVKKPIKLAKKVKAVVKPVEPVVVAEPVVENGVVDEPPPLDMTDDTEALAKEAEEFIAQCGGTIPMVKKYKEMLEIINAKDVSVSSSKKGGRKAKEYTYEVDGFANIKNGMYSATLIPYHKTDLTKKVGPFVWGVKVIDKKRETVVSYEFKVLKYCKKDIYPVSVKDVKTGICYKVGGGMIDMATTDGVVKVYTMTDLVKAD